MAKNQKSSGFLDGLESLSELKEAGLDYIDLRKDALKLRLVEDLSVLFNSLFSNFLLVLFAFVALVFIASGINTWLGEAIGSQALASMITGGLFLIGFLLLYIFRKKLFINSIVSIFSKVFFEKKEEEEGDE